MRCYDNNQKNSLFELLNETHLKTMTLIEIGSFRGESAEIFLSSGKVNKIYCIDPWVNNYNHSSIQKHFNMQEVEADFDSRFKNEHRVIKHKGTIDSFISKFHPENEFLNNEFPIVVYIDGHHDYEFVKNDIIKTLVYIKPAFITGHDYDLLGVESAVDEILGMPQKVFKDSSWLIKM